MPRERRERRASTWLAGLTASALSLGLSFCAFRTPGAEAELELVASEMPESMIAALRIESVELLPCDSTSAALERLRVVLFDVPVARAHDDSGDSLGPFRFSFRGPARSFALGRLALMPGSYCEVRLSLSPDSSATTLRIEDGDGHAVHTDARRMFQRRLPGAPWAFDAARRRRSLLIEMSFARLAEAMHAEADLSGERALALVVDSTRAGNVSIDEVSREEP